MDICFPWWNYISTKKKKQSGNITAWVPVSFKPDLMRWNHTLPALSCNFSKPRLPGYREKAEFPAISQNESFDKCVTLPLPPNAQDTFWRRMPSTLNWIDHFLWLHCDWPVIYSAVHLYSRVERGWLWVLHRRSTPPMILCMVIIPDEPKNRVSNETFITTPSAVWGIQWNHNSKVITSAVACDKVDIWDGNCHRGDHTILTPYLSHDTF